MGSLVDYVEAYGNISFAEKPFTAVDSLVLAQLAYLNYSAYQCDLSGREDFIPLQQLLSIDSITTLFSSAYNESKMRQLLLAILYSQRFGKIQVNYYVNHLDQQEESQFAAITYRLELGSADKPLLNEATPNDALIYVAFRGTDNTIVGWKEDFNMTFEDHVPSQHYASQYVQAILSLHPEPLMIGGHSKGGNLAVFAAVEAPFALQERILAVYNFDGPGFPAAFISTPQYAQMRDKIHVIIPRTAIVGKLLTQIEHYQVVQSEGFAIFQHDPFTWVIEQDHFVWSKSVDAASLAIQKTLNDWLLSIDLETRRDFINIIFDLLYSTRAFTFREFYDHLLKNLYNLFRKSDRLDGKTMEFIAKTVELTLSTTYSSIRALPRFSSRCFYCRTKMDCQLDVGNNVIFHCPKCGRTFCEVPEAPAPNKK